jgi:hypothetical protein
MATSILAIRSLRARETHNTAKSVPATPQSNSRLRFEARQWVISKILPKTFGDKLQLKHSGRVASSVITPDMDPIEASRVYQRLMNGDDDREE